MNGRMRLRTKRIALSILGLTLLCGCSRGLKRGEMAPDFALESTSGDTVRLYEATGDVTLLCFWAVGCPPCRDEAPHFQHLHDTYGDRGLSVIAVNAWDEAPGMVRGFLNENKLRYTELLNGADVHRNQYEGQGVPNTYLIDREHRIQFACVGWSSGVGRDIESQIQQMLADSGE